MGRNARQCGQEPNSPAAHCGEKPIKAVISKPIIHRSFPGRANIRLLGLENKSTMLPLPQDNRSLTCRPTSMPYPRTDRSPWTVRHGRSCASPTHSAPCMPRASWNLQQNHTASDAGKTTSTVTLPLGGMSMARCCLESLILCRVPDLFAISKFQPLPVTPCRNVGLKSCSSASNSTVV